MRSVEDRLLFVIDEQRRFRWAARNFVRDGADKDQKEQQLGHDAKLRR